MSRDPRLMLAAMVAANPAVLSILPEAKPTKVFLHADQERLDKAKAKRDRKADKRKAAQAKGED